MNLEENILEGIGEEIAAASSDRVPIVTCTVEDILHEADLAEYCQRSGNLPAVKSDEKDLSTLRARHHQVARLLATGLPEGVVAELTGYQVSTVSTLKQSPSMLELIAHYRMPGDNATKEIAEKLRLVGDMSLERLIAKIEADEMDNNQLLAAAKLGVDRSNNGPMAKFEHTHVHGLDENQMRRLNDSARKTNAGRIIDIQAVRQSLPAPPESKADDAS